MAKEKKEKTPGYEEFHDALQSGAVRNVYIFHGEETYLMQQAVAELQARLVPAGFEEFNYHRLTGKGLTVQEVVEAAEAMPMMAERTLVTVEDMDLFKLDEAQRGALVALLEDFPEYCTLVFLYRQIPYKTDARLKKLTAALAERAQVIEFAQQGQQKLQKWVRRRFAAAGKDIDAGTVDHLLFTCGSLMTGLVPEIAKIAAYARGAKITAADIDAVADPVLDARVFDMTDAVAARDYDKAAECLAELLRMQEEPIRILAALGKTLRQLYTARLAIDGGKDVLWLKDLWRMKFDYPAKKLMQSARGVRRSWCREAVTRCQTLDHRMKSERNMDSEGELKLFLMELAGVK
jgi:DNA polymerase-3 subunit delta